MLLLQPILDLIWQQVAERRTFPGSDLTNLFRKLITRCAHRKQLRLPHLTLVGRGWCRSVIQSANNCNNRATILPLVTTSSHEQAGGNATPVSRGTRKSRPLQTNSVTLMAQQHYGQFTASLTHHRSGTASVTDGASPGRLARASLSFLTSTVALHLRYFGHTVNNLKCGFNRI